ncbi:hypothetical protein Tco_1301328 [Tanacetum coccineum]
MNTTIRSKQPPTTATTVAVVGSGGGGELRWGFGGGPTQISKKNPLTTNPTSKSATIIAARSVPRHTEVKGQRSFDMALYYTLERIVTASGPVFNTFMEIDLLSNPREMVAPKLIKTMTDIYFTMVAKDAEFTFSLSPRQMALWKSQREDHTSDWLRAVHISGLGQTINDCSRVFCGDIYGDRVVSYAGIIGLDVCVDLTGSSPLTQIEMADFVPSIWLSVQLLDMGFFPFLSLLWGN